MSDDRPMDRRRFFREGLRELLKPLADAAEPIERALHEFAALQEPAEPRVSRPRPTAAPPAPTVWLRPPGALAESDFLETCSRCGICVSVCPAQAIRIDKSAARGDGAPYIIPSEMPCVVCEGLHCMNQCPSGALTLTPIA